MTDLVYWKGRVVPWVAKWSDEDLDLPYQILRYPENPPETRYQLVYRDPSPVDRDRNGALWFRDGMARTGTPHFGVVHARRQRLCMTRPRCQVCGKDLPKTDVPWLLTRQEYDAVTQPPQEPLTSTPPTCEDCWELAELLCPHLRAHDLLKVHVGQVRPWGVRGDLYTPKGEVHQMRRVPFDSVYGMRMTIAKQLIVALDTIKPA